MRRYDRARFAAYGLTATVNALALLLYAFNASFRMGPQLDLWIAIALGLACLLWATLCAVRRGRDLGWPALPTALGFPLSLALMPSGLLLAAFLCLGLPQPGAARVGPAPAPAGALKLWLGALLGLALPWALLLPLALAR